MGDMNFFEIVLRDFTIVESQSTYSTMENWLKVRSQQWRLKAMFILPFLSSRLSGYWIGAHSNERELYQQHMEICPDLLKDAHEFVYYYLPSISCSPSFRFCPLTTRCLWHSAIDFYSCSAMEEEYKDILSSKMPSTQQEDYDWIRFTEAVLVNLDYVHSEPILKYYWNGRDKSIPSLSHVIKGQIRAISEGLGIIRCFRKSIAKWNFEGVEYVTVQILDFYGSIENLPHRATHIFARLFFFKGKMCEDEFSTLVNMVNVALFQAKDVYLQALRALKLSHEDYRIITCETLLPFIDDLQNILKTFMDDHHSSHKFSEVNEIVLELEFIKSMINHTSDQSLESWIAYAIATHIDVLAAQAADASQKITDIRNNIKATCRNYSMLSGCIGGLLSYIRFVDENNVLRLTSTATLFTRLDLLHTFLTNTEYLLCLSPEFQNTCVHIEQMFCGAWWDLRSLWFKNLNSNKLDFPTICFDFLKGITPNMAQPNELLLLLIQSLVQMPDAKLLLFQLRESIVPTKKDQLFAKLMYSRGSNLGHLIDADAINNLIRDVDVGGIEAAQIYILFFSELNDGVSFGALETVEGFKASVRQAYADYVKLSHMELPKSELGFCDMILNLEELHESYAYLSISTAQQIGVLHDYLLICSSFLQRYAIRDNESEEVKGLWSSIMNLCRQMNNILDTFEEFPDWFLKLRLFSVTEDAKLITEEIHRNDTVKIGVQRTNDVAQSQIEKFQAVEHSDDDPQSKDEDQKLGFEEEDNLTTQLTTGSKRLEKIAIVGMPGLGKTTLAMNLYKGCAKSFSAHAWCYVGQEFQRKELLRDIISQISERSSNKLNDMGVEDLAKELKQSLLTKKNYLIVLDDVWNSDAWDALQISFPPGDGGSRILITSRLKTVGEKVCGNRNVLELDLFSKEKSWCLLEKKVFGEKKCPQNLRQVGKEIAEKCEGLPLSIVVIGGALKNKEKTEKSWNQVAESLDSYLVAGGLGTLELSYRHLSVRMKQCFLYCSTFMKGKEIPRSKLVRLWLAERFIEEPKQCLENNAFYTAQPESLESAAEKFLLGLVDRSLLMVAKTGSDNRIQTCRIHDLLRDFCVQKANDEKLMITIDGLNDPPSFQQRSRLCFFSGDEFGKFRCDEGSTLSNARSLTFLTTGRTFFPEKYPNSLPLFFEHFKSLTLLNLENINAGSKIPPNVAGLKLLRYLALRDGIKSIPSSIGELLNLETLIVIGTRGEVDVPDTIFNLSKLRHLVVNKRARVNINDNNPNCLSNLENFSTPVLSKSTAEQIIARLPNLRKLRCILMDASFNLSILKRLSYLESLRAFYHGGGRFQSKLSFPSKLYKLTLSKFCLAWSEINNIAALLPELKILKLLFKACEGDEWSTTETFNKLKYLRMEEVDIKKWEASEDNFPRLERLVVRRCKQLHRIPEDFANIVDLMCIESHGCDVSVVKSVLKIKRKQISEGNMKFETIISPTVHHLDDEDEDEDEDEFSD